MGNRGQRRRVGWAIEPDIHRRVKAHAAVHGVGVDDVVNQILGAHLPLYPKRPRQELPTQSATEPFASGN